MLTLLIIAPVFLAIFLITRILRILFFPFHHHHRHHWSGYNQGWNRPYSYNYNPYARPRFGGLLSIAALFAIDRLFGRRW